MQMQSYIINSDIDCTSVCVSTKALRVEVAAVIIEIATGIRGFKHHYLEAYSICNHSSFMG